ncbi:unnamed protein product [Ambrosiozyma monospora]|uniref:Unnamed protein product n=1 Tax=Ambrosiozyma monospora TaxID=43982 RepID=A0ACB5TAV3_AMBMO|nr:unnamed protein product [Ambrosiozyma monospora]
MSIDETLKAAIRTMFAYGMHKDNSNNVWLDEEEKRMYKRTFHFLFHKDRMLSLSFVKNYSIEKDKCSTPPLDADDYHGTAISPESVKLLKSVARLDDLLENVLRLQKQSNISLVKGEAINQYIEEMNTLCQNCYRNLVSDTEHKLISSFYEFVEMVYFHALNIFIQRVNILRYYSLINEYIQSNSNVCRSDLDKPNLISNCWISSANSAQALCEIIADSTVKFRAQLLLDQNIFFLIFLSVSNCIPMVHWIDPVISKKTTKSLDKAVKSLDELEDIISMKVIRACHYILTKVYPNTERAVLYSRKLLNLDSVENILAKVHQDPTFSHEFLVQITPPYVAPLLKVEVTTTDFIDKRTTNSGSSNVPVPKSNPKWVTQDIPPTIPAEEPPLPLLVDQDNDFFEKELSLNELFGNSGIMSLPFANDEQTNNLLSQYFTSMGPFDMPFDPPLQ